MKDGAILSNTGHFNVEIEIAALRELAVETREARALVDEFTLADGRRLYLIGEGRLVNLAAAEGHPAIVMDMSFANQALSAEWVVAERGNARAARVRRPEGHRRRDRTAQARDDGRRPSTRSPTSRRVPRQLERGDVDRTVGARRCRLGLQPATATERRGLTRGSRVLQPERIVRLEERRRRPPRPAAAARRGGRAPLRVGGRGRGRHPRRWRSAARLRSASPRPTATRSRRRAERISTRRTRCSSAPVRPRSTSVGRSRRCAPIRRRSARGHSTRRRSTAAGAWRDMRLELVPPGRRLLTHCNTGGLATGGYGTALGAIRAAWERGLVEHVWVDETRPLLQGARLTAWELEALGIPFAVIADGAAASLMAAERSTASSSGADRIAANGDTANKIGTYALAVAAAITAIPLVRRRADVDARLRRRRRAPTSRSRSATRPRSRRASRRGTPPSTSRPRSSSSAIVTEEGIHRAPYAASLPNRARPQRR